MDEATKVLFLDIDGVLNCTFPTPSDECEWVDLDEWRYGFNPQLVARLRYILTNTGCKIVVSSSWRHHTSYAPYEPSENWRDVLAKRLGRTREQTFAGETGYDKMGKRGKEINKWLEEHPVDSFCVVDDETVDISPYVDNKRVVKTDMKDGLTMEDARRIIQVLNNGS